MNDLEERIKKVEKRVDAISQELRFALSYIESNPKGSLTNSRMVMEHLLQLVYKAEMGEDPKRSLLGEILSNNQFTRKIDRNILARINFIRELGNLGPHLAPPGDAYAVSPNDASKALDALCEVLEWYLQRYGGAAEADTSILTGASDDIDLSAGHDINEARAFMISWLLVTIISGDAHHSNATLARLTTYAQELGVMVSVGLDVVNTDAMITELHSLGGQISVKHPQLVLYYEAGTNLVLDAARNGGRGIGRILAPLHLPSGLLEERSSPLVWINEVKEYFERVLDGSA